MPRSLPSSSPVALVLPPSVSASLGYKPEVAREHLVGLILALCTWSGEIITLPFLQDILRFSTFQFMTQSIMNFASRDQVIPKIKWVCFAEVRCLPQREMLFYLIPMNFPSPPRVATG